VRAPQSHLGAEFRAGHSENVTQHPKGRRVTVHVDATPHVAYVDRVWHRMQLRIARYRGLDRPTDFDAAGAQDNTRGFSTLQTLLSGVVGCGRSALLVCTDLDVRTVRIACHFNDVARGLCLWPGSLGRRRLRLFRRETGGRVVRDLAA
jgi:hypothetical protein